MVAMARPHTDPVRTLPGSYYADPAIFALEQERIFSTVWVCVGRADSLPQPGGYFLTTAGVESVIVLRDLRGTLRAFLNVCRHRGARVCTAAQGRVKTMMCRYHAWTYRLDGSLAYAPNMADDPGFDIVDHGLLPVPLDTWEGYVWLNLADDPEPLRAQLGALHELYARYHLGELRVGRTITYDVRANWKLLVENFNECCHCANAHPELAAQVPSFKAGVVTGKVGGGAVFGEGIESLTVTGKTNRRYFPDLTEEDRITYYGETLRPNVFLNLHPDYAVIHMLAPLGPDRTQVTCHWLFEPGVVAQPGFDVSDAVDFWDLVNRQDWELCEITQQNMHSRAYHEGGLYAPRERHIRAFDDYVLEKLGHGEVRS